jgi:hypothetical protein
MKGSDCCLTLRYDASIFVEGIRKSMRYLSKDNRSPVRDLKAGPPEYEAGILAVRPRRSVIVLGVLVPCIQPLELLHKETSQL